MFFGHGRAFLCAGMTALALRAAMAAPRVVSTVGTAQSSQASSRRLATSPVVCRNGRANSAFNVRHAWMAASVNMAGRPRIPPGSASHTVAGSNQICSEPRCFGAALQERQFVVR